MFEVHRLKHAARIYAEQVPHYLKRHFGSHEYFTEPQVRAAIFHLNLDATYIFLAYAMFLKREEYEALLPRLPLYMSYEASREMFITYEPEDIRSEQFGPDPGTYGMKRTM